MLDSGLCLSHGFVLTDCMKCCFRQEFLSLLIPHLQNRTKTSLTMLVLSLFQHFPLNCLKALQFIGVTMAESPSCPVSILPSSAAAAAKSLVVSDSVRPHRWQLTRLPRPWDFPGKNTGVGCHFLVQCMKVKSESEVTQSCPTLNDPRDCSLPGSSIHGVFQARVLEWGAIAFSHFMSLR